MTVPCCIAKLKLLFWPADICWTASARDCSTAAAGPRMAAQACRDPSKRVLTVPAELYRLHAQQAVKHYSMHELTTAAALKQCDQATGGALCLQCRQPGMSGSHDLQGHSVCGHLACNTQPSALNGQGLLQERRNHPAHAIHACRGAEQCSSQENKPAGASAGTQIHPAKAAKDGQSSS